MNEYNRIRLSQTFVYLRDEFFNVHLSLERMVALGIGHIVPAHVDYFPLVGSRGLYWCTICHSRTDMVYKDGEEA